MGKKSSPTIIYVGNETPIEIFDKSDIVTLSEAAHIAILNGADCEVIARALTRAYYTGALSEGLRKRPSIKQQKEYFGKLQRNVKALVSELGLDESFHTETVPNRHFRVFQTYETRLIGYAARHYDVDKGSCRSSKHFNGPTTRALNNLPDVVSALLRLSEWAKDSLPAPPFDAHVRRPKEGGVDNLFMQLAAAFYAMFGSAPETGRDREHADNSSRLWIEAALGLAAQRLKTHIAPSAPRAGRRIAAQSEFLLQLAEKTAKYTPIYKADRLADGWTDWIKLPDRHRWLGWNAPPAWLGNPFPVSAKITRARGN